MNLKNSLNKVLKFAQPQNSGGKLPKGEAMREIGDTGTQIFEGIVTEEYNSKLQGTAGIEVFDEMRKSDGTCRAAMTAMSLPIRRAKWFIQPASEDKQDIEVAEFISNALFEWQNKTWEDLLRETLLMLPLGVMLFEKVFDTKEVDGKTFIIWKKFASRLPSSVQAWQMVNGKAGIEQNKQDGASVDIPMEKLCIFVNELEGENWWGNSALRPAYKHWYIKNNFYKIQAIAYERQGLGIPKAVPKEGHTITPAEESALKKILQNMRAHEEGYVIETENVSLEWMDMRAGTIINPKDAILHHNREITKSVLAHFLELGSGTNGSRALSTDQTDLFLLSLQSIAKSIADVFNKYAISQLVDLNFENIKKYPKLITTDISRANAEKLSVAYQRLQQTGAIRVGESDEKHFRGIMNLPDRDMSNDENDDEKQKKEDEKRAKKKNEKDVEKDLNLSELFARFKKKTLIQATDRKIIEASVVNRLDGLIIADQINYIDLVLSICDNTNNLLFAEIKSVLTERKHQLDRLIFQEKNNFESFRPLTFAEKKVNFTGIQNTLDRMESRFKKKAEPVLIEAKEKYIKQLGDAIRKKDKTKLKALKLEFKNEYAKILKEFMKEAFEFGKNNAAREMGVATPPNPQNVLSNIDLKADAIASKQADDLVFLAKNGLVQQIEKDVAVAQAIGEVDKILQKKIIKQTTQTGNIIMAGNLNDGRRVIFEKNEELIYALQRSELLDTRTCNFCLSIDARIIEKNDPLAKQGIFHGSCFLPNTKVLTKTGYRKIKDIAVGDIVSTHKDNWKRVYHTMAREYDDEIIIIELENGKKIQCTPNHKFWINEKWVEARDITEDIELSDSLIVM